MALPSAMATTQPRRRKPKKLRLRSLYQPNEKGEAELAPRPVLGKGPKRATEGPTVIPKQGWASRETAVMANKTMKRLRKQQEKEDESDEEEVGPGVEYAAAPPAPSSAPMTGLELTAAALDAPSLAVQALRTEALSKAEEKAAEREERPDGAVLLGNHPMWKRKEKDVTRFEAAMATIKKAQKYALPPITKSEPVVLSGQEDMYRRAAPPVRDPYPLTSQSKVAHAAQQSAASTATRLPSLLSSQRQSVALPDLSKPQRIEPPAHMRVEQRVDPEALDEEEQNKEVDEIALESVIPKKQDQKKADASARSASMKSRNVGVRLTIQDHVMRARSSKRVGDRASEGIAHYNQGILWDNLGNYRKALDCYQSYLRCCQRSADVVGESLAYNHMGVNYQYMGKNEKALDMHRLHLEMGDPEGQYLAHCNMALIYLEMKQMNKSVSHYSAALEGAVGMESLPAQGLALERLGLCAQQQGDFPGALRYLEQRLDVARRLGDAKTMAASLRELGRLASEHGEWDMARVYLQQAVQAAPREGSSSVAAGLRELGQLANKMQRFEEAQECFDEALRLGLSSGDTGLVNRAKVGVGVAKGNHMFWERVQEIREALHKP